MPFRLLVVGLIVALAQSNPKADSAFQKFFAAKNASDAAKAVGDVAKSGISFDDAYRRLKTGRSYTAQKSGVISLHNKTPNGVDHLYSVNVPTNYDPAKRYQVRFQLHGGVLVRDENAIRGTGEIGNLAGAEQIYVLPTAWKEAPWWSDDQILNLNMILDALKRTYNIDENRVVVSGGSDGGTGAYFVGMRDTTPYASYLPLNGFIMVLANPPLDDGGLFQIGRASCRERVCQYV